MEDADESFLAILVAGWLTAPCPVFLVDEVRLHDPELGELVTFVLLAINSRDAVRFADAMSALRGGMPPADEQALFKGSKLYGRRRRPMHDGLRAQIHAVLQQCGVTTVTTCSRVLTRYQSLAPGGIRPVTPGGEPMPPIRGPELVPLMNALKVAAIAHRFGPIQVDVLLDRSGQLGLAPAQLDRPEEQWWIFGPAALNEQADGTPATVQCSSRFRFIAPPKRGPLRDLLLLPDSVAYMWRTQGRMTHRRDKLTVGEDFVVDFESGSAVVASLGL